MNSFVVFVQQCSEIFVGMFATTWICLFFCVQFCIGGTAGISARKEISSALVWLTATAVLGIIAILEKFIIGELLNAAKPDASVAQHVLDALFFILLYWFFSAVSLFINFLGFCVAFALSWQFKIGRGQLSIRSLLFLTALFAVVAALARPLT